MTQLNKVPILIQNVGLNLQILGFDFRLIVQRKQLLSIEVADSDTLKENVQRV
jgi:hypothetical protein